MVRNHLLVGLWIIHAEYIYRQSTYSTKKGTKGTRTCQARGRAQAGVRKTQGCVPGWALSGIAAHLPPLRPDTWASEWGTGRGALRGPGDAKPRPLTPTRVRRKATVRQRGLKALCRLDALGFWNWDVWPWERGPWSRAGLPWECAAGWRELCWELWLGMFLGGLPSVFPAPHLS